ncbi:MAG TPA: M23 family metallopeptidase [Patescibacteria group bacterium]|nr:M23 family metallopeptidase [Patescibacteria group bacterium]
MASTTLDKDQDQSVGYGGQPPQTEDIQNPFPGGEPPEDDRDQSNQESLSDRIRSGYNTAQNIKRFSGAGQAAEAGETAEAGAAAAEGAEAGAAAAEGATAGEATAGIGAAGTAGAEAGAASAAGLEGAGAIGGAGLAGAGAGAGAAGSAAATAGAAAATEAATVTAVGVGATPVGWIAAAIAAVIILIIIIVVFFSGSTSTLPANQTQTNPTTRTGTTGTAICGGGGSSGSLNYSVSLRDTSVLPQNVTAVQNEIASEFPNAHLYDWDHVVDSAVRAGWNPSFILTLWIEESGAQGASGYTDALGCDPTHPTTDLNKSLNCVFNSFRNYDNFDDFMCVYGGDGFHKAPCTFNSDNPNFPGNIQKWYTKLTGGTDSSSPASPLACAPGTPGDWPTMGQISQGPQGATDHARLATYGWNAIDVAGAPDEKIKSAFNGTVTAVHDCIKDGDCSGGYNGFGNSVEVTTNTDKGSFTTLYGHLSEIDAVINSDIKAGDLIGLMGTTGHSTGVHLHYQFIGADMAPPNIPQPIVPLDCDSIGACNPDHIQPGELSPTPAI